MKARLNKLVIITKDGDRVPLIDVVHDIGFEYALHDSTMKLSGILDDAELEIIESDVKWKA